MFQSHQWHQKDEIPCLPALELVNPLESFLPLWCGKKTEAESRFRRTHDGVWLPQSLLPLKEYRALASAVVVVAFSWDLVRVREPDSPLAYQ